MNLWLRKVLCGGRQHGLLCWCLALVFLFGPIHHGVASQHGPVEPLRDRDFQTHTDARIRLGRLLFYDPVLSGTYRVSCGTCHNHDRAGSNGFALRGQDGQERDTAALPDLSRYQQLKPSARHAPALFNLGHRSFTALFWDGRVAARPDGGFDTPAGDALPDGLESVLAAQALFPAVTRDELVGTVDTDLTDEAHGGNRAVWDALAARVLDLEDYAPLFRAAYPQDAQQSVTISQIANAIGAFVAAEWRADRSPYDAFLRGDAQALTPVAQRGEALFRGKAGCAACHAGALQTDHGFHAVATPLWPHTLSAELGLEDVAEPLTGRANVTGRAQDRFRFKTPSLRNIAFTAPYGHAGSFETLPEFLDAHLDPQAGLRRFVETRFGDTPPPAISTAMSELLQRNSLKPVRLTQEEKRDLLAFLEALSDPDGLAGRLGKPQDVPSNLAID